MDPLQKRIDELTEFLLEHGQGCQNEQKHLDAGSKERIYWHYGYLVALKDIQRLQRGEIATLH